MLIDGQFPVAAPPAQLMTHLFDARLMASCLPGCESLERLDDDRYRAVVAVALAGVKARFDLQVQITKREALEVWSVTRGEEGGQASTLQADSQVSLAATPEGTLVSYRSEVAVTGRLGRFALGMMKKKAQSMGDEFAAKLQQALTALEVPTAEPEPATGGPASVRESAPALAATVPGSAPSLATSAPGVVPVAAASGSAPAATRTHAAPAATSLPPAAAQPWWRGLWMWLRGLVGAAPGTRG